LLIMGTTALRMIGHAVSFARYSRVLLAG